MNMEMFDFEQKCIFNSWPVYISSGCIRGTLLITVYVMYFAERTCSLKEFQCEMDNDCIPGTWKCDGEKDCSDGTDETNCGDNGK